MDRRVRNETTEQEPDMTISNPLHKTLISATALGLTLIGANPAAAGQLSPALYGEQLDRCAAAIRADMAGPETARLQHELTSVERTRLWYVIEIRTTARDGADRITDEAVTRCKAHRWTEQTIADISYAEQAGAAAEQRLAVSQ